MQIVIRPFFLASVQTVLVFFIVVFLFLYDFRVAIFSSLIMGFGYLSLYIILRKRLFQMGRDLIARINIGFRRLSKFCRGRLSRSVLRKGLEVN